RPFREISARPTRRSNSRRTPTSSIHGTRRSTAVPPAARGSPQFAGTRTPCPRSTGSSGSATTVGYVATFPLVSTRWASTVFAAPRCDGPGDRSQGPPGQSTAGPAVHRLPFQGPGERDRRDVPVQHRPLQAGVSVTGAFDREFVQQSPSQSRLSVFGPDVEVLEVDAVYPIPGREIQKPQGESDPSLDLRDVTEQGWSGAEQRRLQLPPGQGTAIGSVFVGGELVHQCDDLRNVSPS